MPFNLRTFRRCLSAALFCLISAPIAVPQSPAIDQRFAALRKDPSQLYAFLLRMPKGADLHNHFSGAVYAESYLRVATEDALCVDRRTWAIVSPPAPPATPRCGPDGVDPVTVADKNALLSSVVDSLSMRNFVPGRESAHDHFFATFAKFGRYQPEHTKELLAEVIARAADQNESYLELMALSGGSVNSLGVAAGFDGNFAAAKDKLMKTLPPAVESLRKAVDTLEQDRLAGLGCDKAPQSPGCKVTVRYVYQVLRESPKEQVFAQVLAGFMLASADPRVVAVNFVQPEDGIVSMRDYHLQMQMVDYAKGLYPGVHITLHAGELAPGLVPPDGLRFHIREAVELGHAERIGHGVDIAHETDPVGLLNLMKQRHVMVEINLTSNDVILGVKGKEHPFNMYRKYGVPLALSTDDEGVSRGHLTEEYVRAVQTYDLGYSDLKEMVRNSLEYSFLPGAGYWQERNYRSPAAPCAAGRETKACAAFLGANEKARLQADLEDRFRKFESEPVR